jgi:hypothetical protein
MPRETSPYIVGDYWLDKRRDGASPDIWQITTYRPGSRQIVYSSTKCRELEGAKGKLHSFVDQKRATQVQPIEECKLVPSLFVYWHEHGKKAERPDSIACSLRLFIGFLMQDEAGVEVTMATADRALFARFIAWRMGPHSYNVPWFGKDYHGESKGVRGETVHADLARVAAGMNHQVEYGRIISAPRTAKVDKRQRSKPKALRYTVDQMGAIIGASLYNVDLFRYLMLQVATLVRPEAAAAFDPRRQYDPATGLVDLHPIDKPQTQKRDPIVPAIQEIKPFLEQWAKEGAKPVKSRKRAWRTIRRALGLPAEAEAKTFRYSIATILRNEFKLTVPKEDIELLLGHRVYEGPSGRYAIYDPDYMIDATNALSIIFQRIADASYKWSAVHLLSKTGNGKVIMIDRASAKAEDFRAWSAGAAYRTRTCDPRITNARTGRRTAASSRKRPERSGDK